MLLLNVDISFLMNYSNSVIIPNDSAPSEISLIPKPLPLMHKLGEGLACDSTRSPSRLMNAGRVNHNPPFKSCHPRLTPRPHTLC